MKLKDYYDYHNTPVMIVTGNITGNFKAASGHVIEAPKDAQVTFIEPNNKIPGITVKHLCEIWGVDYWDCLHKKWGIVYKYGTRTQRTECRNAIAAIQKKWREISTVTGVTFTLNDIRYYPLSLEKLLKFVRLMRRMPNKDEMMDLAHYRTFELWFALVFNDEDNKPTEESVFYSESKAHKIYNSLDTPLI